MGICVALDILQVLCDENWDDIYKHKGTKYYLLNQCFQLKVHIL